MKRAFFFAAAAISLAACTSESDIVDSATPQDIAFKVVTQKQTRSAFEGSSLPPETSIYVGAYQKITADANNGIDAQYTPYLNNIEFTCHNPNDKVENRIWNASGYYYPHAGELDFLAYTCDFNKDDSNDDSKNKVTPTATWSCDKNNQYISGLKLEFGEGLKGQTDVCYSDVAHSVPTNGKYNHPALKFYHALSWVMVNFKKGTDTFANGTYKIRHVKIKDVNLSGDLTLSISAASVITPSPSWERTGNAVNAEFPAYVEAGNDGMTFTDAATADTKGILVIPCSEKVISFQYCTQNGVDSEGKTTYTDWIDYSTTVRSNYTWDAGKKYLYNFSFSGTEIQFTTSVEAFGISQENLSIN